MDNGKLEIKDVAAKVNHVLSEKNGQVLVTVQNGVILEIESKTVVRRRKQPNNK